MSHAEGNGTTASSRISHAEGYFTTASGAVSHAEGNQTEARHPVSHAEGFHTQTGAAYQTVVGIYNDPTNTVSGTDDLFVVGNGNSSATRNNAFTVNDDGDVYIDGDLTVNGSVNGFNYSDLFKTDTVTSNNITISAASVYGAASVFVPGKSGYKPIAIIGYDIKNGDGGRNCSYCNLYRCYLTTTYNQGSYTGSANFSVRNTYGNNSALIKITFYILYVKV